MKTVIFFLFFSVSISQADEAKACPARTDFDKIIKVVTENFYDRSFRDLDWPERVSFFRSQVPCEANDSEIAIIVNGLLKELKASHTGLYTPEELRYWGLKSVFSRTLTRFKIPFSGIWPIEIEGKYYAKYVLGNSATERSGVRPGDLLISINDSAFRPLGFEEGQTSTLKFSPEPGVENSIEVRPFKKSMQIHLLDAMDKSQQTFFINGKKIGYFHLWCGTHPAFLALHNSILKSFRDKKVNGLVIDFRDGYGGASPEYLKLLTKDKYLRKVPKSFIINGGVTSGKEWVAAIVKRDKLGALVGTKTAGAFLGGSIFEPLGERFLLYLAVQEFKPPGIPEIEGIGITPDIEVSECTKSCQGIDPLIVKALEKASAE